MARRRIDDAAHAMGGAVNRVGGGTAETAWFDGAVLDSRKVRGGELFFALPGEQADGHRFVPGALAAGAAAAVVHQAVDDVPEGSTLIRVPDTYAALHDLTRWVRSSWPRTVVGITGSAGKTTTKELIGRVLARRHRVATSPGNLNNLYGFPLALLGAPDDTELLVAEMGMSTPGELAGISRLGHPDVAVLINVRPVHLENFGTLRAIADAKAEILAGLAPGGTFVANGDDPEVERIAAGFDGPVLRFGRGIAADVRLVTAESLDAGGGSRMVVEGTDPDGARRTQEIHLPLLGDHNVDNALAAVAVGLVLGVPLADAAQALAAAEPAAGRGEVLHLPGNVTVIDDSYNSNPDAVEHALAAAATLPAQRRWAVLGAMLELGPEAPRFHREAGAAARRHGFDPVAGVGAEARPLAEATGGPWLPDATAATEWALETVQPGDLVLVKGSRGIALETVVDALRRRAGAEGEVS